MIRSFGEHVTLTRHGHLAQLTFARPPNNHVSVRLVSALADALEDADADPDVRCVVLQSQGRVFCGGADLVSADGVGASGMNGVAELYDQAVRLFAAETPIVAALQGSAVGAGLGLALAADFRVAAPEARFSANFVKLGFHPGFGLTHTLPRLVGAQAASRMFLTGERVKAEAALAMGLVDQLVPAGELEAAALRLAEEIAANAPLAVAATRRTLRAGLAEAVRAQTLVEHEEQAALRATADFEEGVRAVAERRPGRFVGR